MSVEVIEQTTPVETHQQVQAALGRAQAQAAEGARCVCEDDGETRTDHWFDRSICPEPCGAMHDVCVGCGKPKGGCLVAVAGNAARVESLELAAVVLAGHAPRRAAEIDGEEVWRCGHCRAQQVRYDGEVTLSAPGPVTWPCPEYRLAAGVVDVTVPAPTAPAPFPRRHGRQ